MDQNMEKYTDRFFKVPVRMYDEKDLEEIEDSFEMTGTVPKRPYLIAYKAFDINNLVTYRDAWSMEAGLYGAKKDGFDCTLIDLTEDIQIMCDWPSGKFEEELNKFASKHNMA